MTSCRWYKMSRLSPIIESDNAFHIIVVTQREFAHRKPFREVQVDIEEKIKKRRLEEKLKAFVAELREKTPIWTVFDGEPSDDLNQTSNAG